jgi:hypothetical protein
METPRPTSNTEGKSMPIKNQHPFEPERRLVLLIQKGSVATHSGHGRRTVIFARTDQINKNVEKMLNDFEVANVKPSSASPLLHQMDDLAYDPKAISNSIVKAQKTWLSDRGINTKSVSAPVLLVAPKKVGLRNINQ